MFLKKYHGIFASFAILLLFFNNCAVEQFEKNENATIESQDIENLDGGDDQLFQSASTDLVGPRCSRPIAVEHVGSLREYSGSSLKYVTDRTNNIRMSARALKLFILSAQGLWNRSGSCVYLFNGPVNNFSQDGFLAYSRPNFSHVFSVRDDHLASEVFNRGGLLDYLITHVDFDGAVIYEPTKPYTINPATYASGTRNLAIMDSGLKSWFDRKFPRTFPTALGLRNRFDKSTKAASYLEAQKWITTEHITRRRSPNLKDLATIDYLKEGKDSLRDLVIKDKMGLFWAPMIAGAETCGAKNRIVHGLDENSLALQRNIEILLKNTQVDRLIYGWLSSVYKGQDRGVCEDKAVAWISRFSKNLTPSGLGKNFSFHSSQTPGRMVQKSISQARTRGPNPTLRYRKNKTYVAFTMIDSGDSPGYYSTEFTSRQWNDPNRASFPATWAIPNSMRQLYPKLVHHVYNTQSNVNLFVSGMSGLGYSHLFKDYGIARGLSNARSYQTLFPKVGVLNDRMNLRGQAIYTHSSKWHSRSNTNLQHIVNSVSNSTEFLLLDMLRLGSKNTLPSRAYHLKNRKNRIIPIFRSVNTRNKATTKVNGEDKQIYMLDHPQAASYSEAASRYLADEFIQNSKDSQFVLMSAVSWQYNATRLKRTVDIMNYRARIRRNQKIKAFSRDVIPVTALELSDLYKQSLK